MTPSSTLGPVTEPREPGEWARAPRLKYQIIFKEKSRVNNPPGHRKGQMSGASGMQRTDTQCQQQLAPRQAHCVMPPPQAGAVGVTCDDKHQHDAAVGRPRGSFVGEGSVLCLRWGVGCAGGFTKGLPTQLQVHFHVCFITSLPLPLSESRSLVM